jgi:predicted nucleic acid-binding protein
MTVGEIQKGAEVTRRTDPHKAAEIETWLEELCRSIVVHPATSEILVVWAKLVHHRSIEIFGDALIAATALQLGLTVATRNTKDFEPFGVLVTNPFSARR